MPQVEGWGYQPTVKISDPELFLSKRTAKIKLEKRLKERQFIVLPMDSSHGRGYTKV